MKLIKINNKYKCYKPSYGYKYRHLRDYYAKIYRPVIFFFRTSLCNSFFINNTKILKLLFKLLKKGNFKMYISNEIKLKCKNFFKLNFWVNKTVWKKLISDLNLCLCDFSVLKRRKFNVKVSIIIDLDYNDNLTLDIITKKGECIEFLIIINLNYINQIKDFKNLKEWYNLVHEKF